MASTAVISNPLKPQSQTITCFSDTLNDFGNYNGDNVGFSSFQRSATIPKIFPKNASLFKHMLESVTIRFLNTVCQLYITLFNAVFLNISQINKPSDTMWNAVKRWSTVGTYLNIRISVPRESIGYHTAWCQAALVPCSATASFRAHFKWCQTLHL